LCPEKENLGSLRSLDQGKGNGERKSRWFGEVSGAGTGKST
jgi:hypothetical protein